MMKRKAGVLLHPTSLPTQWECGDLGPGAVDFLDFLQAAGCGLWQMLPLGPTGYGDSPYQGLSAFAGNPLLISPEVLVEQGLLEESELLVPRSNGHKVDFQKAHDEKKAWLRKAWLKLQSPSTSALHAEFITYCNDEAWWLDEWTLFAALKEAHQMRSWTEWPQELRQHQADALKTWRAEHSDTVGYHAFCQFLFHQQIQALKKAAHERGIQIIADVPLYVALDSVDVWAWRQFFRVDPDGRPEAVAGVPPDYFSEEGQLWGNPLYRWDEMAKDQFWWWRSRIWMVGRQSDAIRFDHFRGLEAFWEVEADAPTAAKGKWVKAPGHALLAELAQALPSIQLIAEDLGVITDEVVQMREAFGLPGMKILQFAFFTDASDPFLPHNYEQNCVAYTGTHDNNTFNGFMQHEANATTKKWIKRYFDSKQSESLRKAIKSLWASSASWALTPMQDVLELGHDARMNTPGTMMGNWTWRMPKRWPRKAISGWLAQLAENYNR
jgi:4-alpha-glucanotransferase